MTPQSRTLCVISSVPATILPTILTAGTTTFSSICPINSIILSSLKYGRTLAIRLLSPSVKYERPQQIFEKFSTVRFVCSMYSEKISMTGSMRYGSMCGFHRQKFVSAHKVFSRKELEVLPNLFSAL